MTSQNISDALMVLKPGARWVFYGADPTTLMWLDTIQTQPTTAEILAQIASQGE